MGAINKFALILVIGAIVTGIFWVIFRFWLAKPYKEALANGQKPPVLHTFVEGIGGLFPVIAVVLIIRSFLYEPFQIPSGSMMKTLLIGDFLLVEKYGYGIRNPVTNKTWLQTGLPERGDIAVFKYPDDPRQDYIKRVIGLPGDKVSFDPNTEEVTVMPSCQSPIECKPISVSYGELEPSDFVFEPDTKYFLPIPAADPIPSDIKGIRLLQRTETIGGVTHSTLINPAGSAFNRNISHVIAWDVPEGHYFMMGDNRNHSADSRMWGFVPEENLVGKAVFIWISFERQEGEWPTGVRFSRIGVIK